MLKSTDVLLEEFALPFKLTELWMPPITLFVTVSYGTDGAEMSLLTFLLEFAVTSVIEPTF